VRSSVQPFIIATAENGTQNVAITTTPEVSSLGNFLADEQRTTEKYLDTGFIHMRHVVAQTGVHVVRPVSAVERASRAFPPAVNPVTCVTAMHSLVLFASFWALAVTGPARKGIRCRVRVLHRRLYSVVLQHCSKELVPGLALRQMLSKLL
jgi:hypothetical protein